jgi:hypothetical protein
MRSGNSLGYAGDLLGCEKLASRRSPGCGLRRLQQSAQSKAGTQSQKRESMR